MTSNTDDTIQRATDLGTAAGNDAAAWFIRDSWASPRASSYTAEANALSFLLNYPDTYPYFLPIPNLSGEWDGDMTVTRLAYELGLDRDDVDAIDAHADAWERAAADAFMEAVTECASKICGHV